MGQGTRAKRFSGEGSVFQSADHGWYAQLMVAGKRQRRRATTKPEAYQKLEEMRRAAGLGLPPESSDKVRTFIEWWLDVLEAKAQSGAKSPNTVDGYRWAVEKWIIPALGAKRLRDLKPEDVEVLLAGMAARGMSRSSLVRVRSVLGQALDVAVRRGNVLRNVARLAEMPATKAPAERRSLTPDEAGRLLAAAKGDRLEALFVTGLLLGLRPGELTGLTWDDLDEGTETLYVERSLKNQRSGPPGSKKSLQLGETKTARSRRPLRLPPHVTAALRAHRFQQREERLIAGPEWHDRGFIFTTPIGTPLDPSNLRGHFNRLTASAELGHWSPNELRHSAASLMSSNGVPLEIIADVLGHTSTRMLEKHYRHRTRPVIDGHVVVMNDLFGAVEG